jgi:nucleoside-diphosphate-sugar epimerase
MPALVTGATGLLGSHLVDLLLERGESVRALVRSGEPADNLLRAGVDICVGDMCDRTSLQEAVEGVDRVFHCAARTGVWGPRREYESTNIRGVETLLNAALAAGVHRFVHVSSIAVMGADINGSADETAPLRIDPNPYSWSKLIGERTVERAIRRLHAPATIIRPGWIYGPRDVGSFARFAAMIQRGKMNLIGPGNNHLPLVYVRDVAQGMLLASQTAKALGRTYILVNDESVTQREYMNTIANELGVRPVRRWIPYGAALAMGTAAEACAYLLQRGPLLTRYGVHLLGGENRFIIRRAREEIGFSPRFNLAEGVRASVTWYRTSYFDRSARNESCRERCCTTRGG